MSRDRTVRCFFKCLIIVLFALGSCVGNPDLVGAQPNFGGVISAVSQEGSMVQWNTWGNSKPGLCSGKKITLSGEFEKDANDEPMKAYFYKQNVSCEEDGWLTERELDAILNWKEFSQLELSKDQSSIMYFKLVDSSGNIAYLNTGILTLDTYKPVIEEFTTDLGKPSDCKNGIFCCDVPISMSVMEPMVGKSYSGIQTVRYQVFNMGVETQQGVLYDSSEPYLESNRVLKNWTGEFVVDSRRNNSNDVEVVLYVRDFAGNVTVKSMKLKIDITRPVIQVFYDNNQARNERYFSKNRTATICIMERNFRPEEVQIQIENSEGVLPKVSDWKKTDGSGNLDNTKWILEVPYTEEGDYIFDIKYCDLAGNFNQEVDYEDCVSPTKFTIDKTKPVVEVRYDNDEVKNGKYYSGERIATIEIKEHNLDTKDIIISLSADFGEKQDEIPKVQGWNSDGDFHTTSISYVEDGVYTFQLDVVDKAGNRAVDYEEETFCIDTMFPSVEISGVGNQTSNSEDVCLDIVCTDENYTEEQVFVVLKKYGEKEDEGYNQKVENILYEKEHLKSGVHYVYQNFPREIDVDGIYELHVKMTDQAENCTEEVIRFSVNRFGSSYKLGEEIRNINHSYLHVPVDFVVEEMNVDKLISRRVILFKNGQTILLEEGKDYFVEELNTEGKYQYCYTILRDNFKEDGSYQISISSEDEAGNFSANGDAGEKDEICFGIDTVKPILVVYNLENGGVYEDVFWKVKMSVKDNFNLQKVQVYLDDKTYKIWNAQELKELEERNEEISFDIAGDTMLAHRVKIVCLDEAGNECIEEISGFYVTTNRWVYLWKHKFWIGGMILVVVLAGAIFFRIVQKKRSNPLSNFEK